MDMLARREHAPAELAAKLRKRDFETADIDEVIDDLLADDLLSSRRYTEAIVNSRVRRGVGPVRIRADLARMEIDEALIEQVLEEAAIDWFELADSVRHKQFGATLPEQYKERARQMRFLQRRGFDFDCIRATFDAD